jgi:hypothetical protein
MLDDEVQFCGDLQLLMIDELNIAATKQSFRLHFVATEPTHLHVLVSWKDERPWSKVRISIKSSLTRRFNREVAERQWFSEGGSRRRVINQDHFDYLVHTYLPRHSGWKWSEERGLHRDDPVNRSQDASEKSGSRGEVGAGGC